MLWQWLSDGVLLPDIFIMVSVIDLPVSGYAEMVGQLFEVMCLVWIADIIHLCRCHTGRYSEVLRPALGVSSCFQQQLQWLANYILNHCSQNVTGLSSFTSLLIFIVSSEYFLIYDTASTLQPQSSVTCIWSDVHHSWTLQTWIEKWKMRPFTLTYGHTSENFVEDWIDLRLHLNIAANCNCKHCFTEHRHLLLH